MQDRIKVLGIVLKAEPIGEYDRRVVILTREKGKISAFARGARKPTSAFLAPTSPFTFGTFELYAVEFIAGTPVEKLYTFTLKEGVLAELVQIAEKYRRDFLPGEFHTLEILETL